MAQLGPTRYREGGTDFFQLGLRIFEALWKMTTDKCQMTFGK